MESTPVCSAVLYPVSSHALLGWQCDDKQTVSFHRLRSISFLEAVLILWVRRTLRFSMAGFLPVLSLAHLFAFSHAVVSCSCSRTTAALSSGLFLTTGSPSPTLPTLRGLSCTSSRTRLKTVVGTCQSTDTSRPAETHRRLLRRQCFHRQRALGHPEVRGAPWSFA